MLKRICQSRKLAALKTDGARLLYTWLIPNVDVNGCFSADPQVLKGQIFTRLNKPLKMIAKYLQNLADVGLVVIYKADKDIFLCIPDFADNQHYLNPDSEAKIAIPPPTHEQLKSNSRVTPTQSKIESKSKSKIENKYMSLFEPSRKLYCGEKRGLETEFAHFVCKHLDWKEVLPLLEAAVGSQIESRRLTKEKGEFVPPWKNFKTWINQRCWEVETGVEPKKIRECDCGCGQEAKYFGANVHYATAECREKLLGY